MIRRLFTQRRYWKSEALRYRRVAETLEARNFSLELERRELADRLEGMREAITQREWRAQA